MYAPLHSDAQSRILKARQSFTGKTLTDSQFDESWAVAGIIERSIRKSGSFREKLTDYSHAFSRSEKFDSVKGEVIIRDQFKACFGQSMNQLRLGLKEREANIDLPGNELAIDHARMIEPLIKDGQTMPFYQAFEHVGGNLAEKLNITEAGAKNLMKDAYSKIEGRELYEVGKALEAQYHKPKRNAELQERKSERSQELALTRKR